MLHTQLSKANLMAFMAWWPDGTRPLLGIPSVLPAASHVYAGRGPGGLVCSNRWIRNVSAGTHNMQAVDDTSEAVDVDGGLRATADEEKKYRP